MKKAYLKRKIEMIRQELNVLLILEPTANNEVILTQSRRLDKLILLSMKEEIASKITIEEKRKCFEK